MLLQQLVTFCRVVETGSFTRAGELLNLSQPAVTRQVAALEDEFGESLLERQGRALHLTPAGQVVYHHARRAAAVVDSCRSEVAMLSLPDRGHVHVACVTTTGLFTLPALMAEFNARFPAVRFHVWSGRVSSVMDRVLEGESDLGLVTTPVTHPRLDSMPLFKDRVIMVAAPHVAADLADPLPLESLAELQMISYQAPSRFRTLVEAALEQVGVYPQVAMEFDSHEAVKTMVVLGYGVAMVPESAVSTELGAGALREVQVAGLPEIARTTCMLLRRDGGSRSPAVSNFIKLVLDRYTGPAA